MRRLALNNLLVVKIVRRSNRNIFNWLIIIWLKKTPVRWGSLRISRRSWKSGICLNHLKICLTHSVRRLRASRKNSCLLLIECPWNLSRLYSIRINLRKLRIKEINNRQKIKKPNIANKYFKINLPKISTPPPQSTFTYNTKREPP